LNASHSLHPRISGASANNHYKDHNRYYPSQKQFADAILAFMRETIQQEWTKFRDKASDNFQIITHENFQVLK
jgi:hypothetical protein